MSDSSSPTPQRETRSSAKRKASSATVGTSTQAPAFVNIDGSVAAIQVPDSCVGSAEYILRKIDDPDTALPSKAFAAPGKGEKTLKAFVLNGTSPKMIQLSTGSAQQTLVDAAGTQSFFDDDAALAAKLTIGEGIAFLASGSNVTPPMHCMALLRVAPDGTCTLSNLDEPQDWDGLSTVSLANADNTVTGKTVADLRAANSGNYQSAAHVSAKLTLEYSAKR